VHPRRDMLSASKAQKIAVKIAMLGRDRLAIVCLAKAWSSQTVMLPSAMIAVRGKSVGKHDRRDAQRAQDQLCKNTNAVLGNVKKRDLFHGTGFQTKILALGVSRLGPPPYQGASLRIWAANVRFGPKSGHRRTSASCPLYPQKRTLVERAGMSALCQKQTSATNRSGTAGQRY